MRAITPASLKTRLLKEAAEMGCLRKRILNDHVCQGRITLEHVFIWSGRQINDYFSIIPLCEFAHSVGKFQDGGILNKHINEWLALQRATPEDLVKYPKYDWTQRTKYLNSLVKECLSCGRPIFYPKERFCSEVCRRKYHNVNRLVSKSS